jgi:hypothetical protein
MARGSSQYFSSGSARSEISNRVVADVKSPIKGLGKMIRGKTIDNVTLLLVNKSLQESERIIANEPFEYASVYKNGVQVMVKTSGKTNQVIIKGKELKTLEGAVFTHNHPFAQTRDGQILPIPFSRADLILAREYKLKEIRAVSGNTVFSVEPSPEFYKIPLGKFKKILNDIRDQEVKNLGFDVKKFNKYANPEQVVDVLDRTFKEFDRQFNIKYTKSTL